METVGNAASSAASTVISDGETEEDIVGGSNEVKKNGARGRDRSKTQTGL